MSSNNMTGKKPSDKTGDGTLMAETLWPKSMSDTTFDRGDKSIEDEFEWNESADVNLERPIKSNAQIRDLGDEDFILSEPILVTIEEYPEEEVFIVSWPEIELFADGVTETEAIGNLKLEILDLFEELNENDYADLGAKPKGWFRILSKLITMA